MQLLRSGFTIIEMLVVLAILTVLAGLLLPAIVKARESSARARCQSHLQHIGMALQGYHNHFGALPPAVLYQPYQIVTGVESTNFGPNWAVLLLPYTEHSALWVPIATSVNRYRETPGESGWRSVRRERVSLFLCPSDVGSNTPYDSAAIGAGWARGNYGANHGPTRFGSASTTNSDANDHAFGFYWFSISDYGPVRPHADVLCTPAAGYPFGPLKGNGPMSGNFGASLATLNAADGASHVIAVDELRIGPDRSDPRGTWALGLAGASISAGNGWMNNPAPNDNRSGGDSVEGCQDRTDVGMGCTPGTRSWNVTARSRHPGGVNALLCDGGVRFIRNAIDPKNWFLLHSFNDGQAIQEGE